MICLDRLHLLVTHSELQSAPITKASHQQKIRIQHGRSELLPYL